MQMHRRGERAAPSCILARELCATQHAQCVGRPFHYPPPSTPVLAASGHSTAEDALCSPSLVAARRSSSPPTLPSQPASAILGCTHGSLQLMLPPGPDTCQRARDAFQPHRRQILLAPFTCLPHNSTAHLSVELIREHAKLPRAVSRTLRLPVAREEKPILSGLELRARWIRWHQHVNFPVPTSNPCHPGDRVQGSGCPNHRCLAIPVPTFRACTLPCGLNDASAACHRSPDHPAPLGPFLRPASC